MAVALGILLAVVGGIAALAGFTAERRADRLRSSGHTAWATVVAAPAGDSDDSGDGAAGRVLLQYRVQDAVIERPASGLAPGGTVLVWYDPADPGEILVFGRDGRLSNAAFATVGILFILGGAAIGGFGH
jgi:hypothetical protein